MEGSLSSLSPSKRSKPVVLDDSSGVVRFVREQPPENCVFKVESFSLLQEVVVKSTKQYINSAEFEAGGYTWALYVYPSGNKQEGGEGHLSLSVTLTDKLDSGTSLNVALRFFVHDQVRDNYLAVVDTRDKCFHALKPTWGIPKLMPLESFTDVSNGFVVNDCCVFGAEVLLREDALIKRSTMSLLKSYSSKIRTWKISNFSDLSNQQLDLYSPKFSFGEWSWNLVVHPRGVNAGEGKYISLFLKLDNANDLPFHHGKILHTKACLCVKNQGEGPDESRIMYRPFASESASWGYPCFLSISDVYDTSKGFLVNDTLIVQLKIEAMFLLKDTEPTLKKKNKLDTNRDDKYAFKSSVPSFFKFFKQCLGF